MPIVMVSKFIKAVLSYKNAILFLTFVILSFCLVQGNACVVQSVAPSVRVLASPCLLHVDYHLTEFTMLLSSLENVSNVTVAS